MALVALLQAVSRDGECIIVLYIGTLERITRMRGLPPGMELDDSLSIEASISCHIVSAGRLHLQYLYIHVQ